MRLRIPLLVILLCGSALAAWWLYTLQAPAADDVPEEVAPAPDEEEGSELQPITLAARSVTFDDGREFTFRIAEPFSIAVAAEGLGKARFMAMSPDDRLFVPDLVDYQLSHEGAVYILEDFNTETKRFETQHTYLSGLRGANSIAFHTDAEGDHWLYLALTEHLVRYPYAPGDTEPSREPEVILEFPNTQAENARSVVWHLTRTIAFRDGRLYISIGSGCNACEQPPGDMRAMIASILPDGSDLQVYAEGLRNAVDFTWADDVMYATENGADHLGADLPDERMYRLTEGAHYGWPYCYELDGDMIPDTSVEWDDFVSCSELAPAFAAFEPRSAPLGVEYFNRAHPVLQGAFLVALHGSFDPALMRGNRVMRVAMDGTQEVFMDGFQNDAGERHARPLGFLQHGEDAFFLSDDHGGRIFYIYRDAQDGA